jgi:DNA-directed RNA polymerase subunit alpha
MAILAFQKPDRVIMQKANEFNGLFEFRPLEPGFGVTIGNSLRRILLSSLEGYAITSVKITGVSHEFSTIKGVVEDVTEIILNLKQVRFKKIDETADAEKIFVVVTKQETLKGSDIAKFSSSFKESRYYLRNGINLGQGKGLCAGGRK